MINNLSIKNFKSLRDCELKLKNYNILCGTNACGKSSILQAILLLVQNNGKKNTSQLNGRIVRLGEFYEVRNFKASRNERIVIDAVGEAGKQNRLEFWEDEDENNILKAISSYKQEFALENEKDIFYLSANRLGNADTYEVYGEDSFFGVNGEFSIGFLMQHQNDRIDCDNGETHSFLELVNFWLKKITGSEVRVGKLDKTNKVVASYSNSLNQYVRNANTGSGLSYVISILIMGLGVSQLRNIASSQSIIIIENPEIHLHPKAQAVLSEFLISISNRSQIIIETHSDHIFNAYRIALRNKKIDIASSKMYFFKLHNDETSTMDIKFTSSGKILTKEKDLFDQFDIDLFKLLS